jgi:hypothetical protein
MNKVIFSATIEAAILDGKNNECCGYFDKPDAFDASAELYIYNR